MNGVSSWQDYEYLIKLFAYHIKKRLIENSFVKTFVYAGHKRR